MGKLEKTYILAGGRRESKEIISLELVEETPQPPLKTATLRIGLDDDFKALGEPTFTRKLKVTVEVIE